MWNGWTWRHFPHCAIPACLTGCLALIDDPNLSDEKLRRIIPAPDFPTGGEIMGLDGAAKLYTTGAPTYRRKHYDEIDLFDRESM